MNFQSTLLSFILIGALCTDSFAQNDYREDNDFFNSQIPVYEEWLKRQQLAGYFAFGQVAIEIDTNNLRLNMIFMIKGISASINGIRQLNQKYKQQTGFSLEEALFQKAIHLFEVSPTALSIKVESISDYGEPPGIASILRYKKSYIEDSFVITPFSTLRSEVKDSVVIQDFELPDDLLLPVEMQVESRDYRQKKHEICNQIKRGAKKYFESKGGYFEGHFFDNNTVTLKVQNLKHEVVGPGFFKIFDPHEFLSFKIKLIPHDNNSLKLLIKLDGKYGPGLHKPRSKDYHDMDPKFKAEMESYAERFAKEKVRSWISK